MNENFSPALTRGISEHYLYESMILTDYVGKFFQQDDIDGAYQDEVTWQGLGLPQEHFPLEPVTYDGIQPSYSVRYLTRTWTLGIVIPIEDKQDDLYSIIHKFFPMQGGEFARSYATLNQILGSQFFGLYGFQSGTSVPFSPDGLSFFNTAHPVAQGSTQTYANRPTVDADLSTSIVWQADAAMRAQPRPTGYQFMENMLKRLMVHTQFRIPAMQILHQADWQPYSADRTSNKWVADMNIEVVASPYWQYSGTQGAASTPIEFNSFFFQGDTHYCKWLNRSDLELYPRFDNTVMGDIITAMKRFTYGLTDVRGLWGSKGS